MFSWLEGLVSSIASSIGGVFEGIGDTIVGAIWDNLVKWLFNAFYDSIADVFSQMGDMGAEIFDLSWIESAVHLFFLFGWVLFGVGVIVAAFDLAVEYQNGRANIKSTMLNVLKGFFAANLVTVVPVNLYTFCISLQNVFLKDLAADYVGSQSFNLGEVALKVLAAKFGPPTVGPSLGLLNLLTLIALAYCVLKVFFANIKRGGILLIQMAVGSLYLFSVPPGLHRWVQPMVQADLRPVPDCFPPNSAVVPGLAHVPGQSLAGPGHHAGGWGGAEDRPAVRSGFVCKGQHDERRPRHFHRCQHDPEYRESSLRGV